VMPAGSADLRWIPMPKPYPRYRPLGREIRIQSAAISSA
jgi:hypothetical protein